MDQNLNISTKAINSKKKITLRKKNSKKKIQLQVFVSLGRQEIFRYGTKSISNRGKNNTMDFIKINSFCASKDTQEIEKKTQRMVETFTNHVLDKV